METVLLVDSSCDLPLEFIEKSEVEAIGLMCHFKGNEYEDDFGKTLKYEEFYDAMRKGEKPSTSQINSYRFYEKFKKLVEKNKEIVYLAFDSTLSGTFNSAEIARMQILDEYPNASIKIIDTKCASIGEGLVNYYAWKALKSGKTGADIISWAKENCNNMNHWFVVENLFHLRRGGRLSMSKAVVGTLLNIKPIVFINENGELINTVNIRGRKKAIRFLEDKLKERGNDFENMVVGISHGDCLSDAEYLKDIIKSELGIKEVIINHVGPVIGSHVGPGMLSLCFFSNKGRKII
ncbi:MULTISPECIES: DegV family protein [Clostridium]|uniref:DegV family protein n=1 Tax=Clostridium TaxID=1485 RepID=UPI00069DDE8A|nr:MULTISPECIES: DegV family protein [Clostridium]KOF55847.1 DegV domain-containing protein [Clostridium sp. DMHC 10]MCD2348562.1 DegV family protein [Clostridium guangxiense]